MMIKYACDKLYDINQYGTCYPLRLGVTKEIMSRGPQVADMECREPY
jgi:hypothetical protein